MSRRYRRRLKPLPEEKIRKLMEVFGISRWRAIMYLRTGRFGYLVYRYPPEIAKRIEELRREYRRKGIRLRVIGIIPSTEIDEIIYKFERGSLPNTIHLLVRYPWKWYENYHGVNYYEEARRKLRELSQE